MTRNIHSSTLALAASLSTKFSATLAKWKSGFTGFKSKCGWFQVCHLDSQCNVNLCLYNRHTTSLCQGLPVSCACGILLHFVRLKQTNKKLQLHHSYYHLNSSDTAKAKSSLSSLWSAVKFDLKHCLRNKLSWCHPKNQERHYLMWLNHIKKERRLNLCPFIVDGSVTRKVTYEEVATHGYLPRHCCTVETATWWQVPPSPVTKTCMSRNLEATMSKSSGQC